MSIRKTKDGVGIGIKDKAASRIATTLLNVQVRFSQFMNANVKGISIKRMKTIVVMFCITSGGFSVYIATMSIVNEPKKPTTKIDRLRMPLYDKGINERIYDEQSTDEAYQLIQPLQKYIDSLQQTKLGQRIYDSLHHYRPGLIDTLNTLKKIYESKTNE